MALRSFAGGGLADAKGVVCSELEQDKFLVCRNERSSKGANKYLRLLHFGESRLALLARASQLGEFLTLLFELVLAALHFKYEKV